LARRHPDGVPVQIRLISERHNIPSRFLVQILLQLKGAGIVTSTRGASGGYQLGRSPCQISLLQIIEAVEGGSESSLSKSHDSAEHRLLSKIWTDADQAYRKTLNSTSLQDLVILLGDDNNQMYFI